MVMRLKPTLIHPAASLCTPPISSGRPPVLGRGNRRFTARIGAVLCKMLYMDFDEKAPFPTLGE
jgi:hypothetical protein